MRLLVTGGSRSGKSAYAENQLIDMEKVDYLATSYNDPADAEWQHRIKLHRERRPQAWKTIETLKIASEISKDSPAPLMIDCLGVWLSRVMDEHGFWESLDAGLIQPSVDEVISSLEKTSRDVVLVTNEVGWSLVPPDAGSRAYRDELGRLNAKVAEVCDKVVLCVAGQPLTIKGQK